MAAKMGVDPAQLRQASEAMASMSPEDMAKASEQARALPGATARVLAPVRSSADAVLRAAQMKNMSPEDMKRQLEAASSQGSAQQQYYYNVRRGASGESEATALLASAAPDARFARLIRRRRPRCSSRKATRWSSASARPAAPHRQAWARVGLAAAAPLRVR